MCHDLISRESSGELADAVVVDICAGFPVEPCPVLDKHSLRDDNFIWKHVPEEAEGVVSRRRQV
jgi:hypothetical protein